MQRMRGMTGEQQQHQGKPMTGALVGWRPAPPWRQRQGPAGPLPPGREPKLPGAPTSPVAATHAWLQRVRAVGLQTGEGRSRVFRPLGRIDRWSRDHRVSRWGRPCPLKNSASGGRSQPPFGGIWALKKGCDEQMPILCPSARILRPTQSSLAIKAMLEQAESIGLAPAARRDAAGGPLLEEEETVLQQFAGMQLVIGGTADQGEGTLYFTEW